MRRASVSPGDLLAVGVLSLPLLALAVLRAVPGTDVRLEDAPLHMLLVRGTALSVLSLGMFALGNFLATGRQSSVAIACGLLGFAAVYIWRGVFATDDGAFNFQLYGPTARVLFAISLLGLLHRSRIKTARGRAVRAVAVVGVAVCLALTGLGLHNASLALQNMLPRNALLVLPDGIDCVSIALSVIACSLLLRQRQAGRHVSLVLLIGVGLSMEQAIASLGSTDWLASWWAAQILTLAGMVVLTWGVLVGISEAERNANRLAEQVRVAERARSQAMAIFDAARVAMVLISPDGTVATANQPFTALLGRQPEDLAGVTVAELKAELRELFGDADVLLCGVQADSSTSIIQQYYPVERDLERYLTILRAPDGEVLGRLLAFRDVTREQEVSRMKSEFVSVVTHELRTPLTSIRGSLGLLAAGLLGEVPPNAQRMLDIAVQNADRLIRLINDILDLERMQSGRIALDRRPSQMRDVITAAVETTRAMAEAAGVRIEIVPFMIVANVDPDRIVQVVTNLLSNAIKFSPPDTCVRLSAASDGAELWLYVQDHGRGIPADKLESVFERFQQVDASDSRQKGGTGLGLAISRTIVQQHGGRIWATSTLGQGATFIVALPLKPSASATPAAA